MPAVPPQPTIEPLMNAVLLESVLTCPHCGFATLETMPTDACPFFYECSNCKTLLRPNPGDCCVFCSFGSVKCPPIHCGRSKLQPTHGSRSSVDFPRLSREGCMDRVARRDFLVAVSALLTLPHAAEAQQAGGMPRIGYLVVNRAEASRGPLAAFRKGLRECGWVEGQNIIIEVRYAEGQVDQLPLLVAELIRLKVVLRDMALLAIAWASWRFTPASVRKAHHFEWGPIIEVAKLFAGIFLTIIPAIAILRAGHEGAMARLLEMVTDSSGRPNDALFFWFAGAL